MKKRVEVDPWARLIADRMKESPDGIARIDADDLEGMPADYITKELEAGRLGEVRIGGSLRHKEFGKKSRIAIFPVGWKNPAPPIRKVRFETQAAAINYAEKQQRNGVFVRISLERPKPEEMAQPELPEWLPPLTLRFGTKNKPGWYVWEWTPANYLKHIATEYSEVELLTAFIISTHFREYSDRKFASCRNTGAEANKSRAERAAAEQRELFRQLREQYPVENVSKDWLIREKICGAHPRKPGWKMRTVTANLKGLK